MDLYKKRRIWKANQVTRKMAQKNYQEGGTEINV